MIPFSPPRISQAHIDEVIDTLRSGWITTGPKTRLFEKKISEYTGCHATVAISSATIGLELILKWYGVGENDEVIIPVYTYCATANVVFHCGAKPVFVDVNSSDFNISITNIRKAITNRTKVIMPVDFAGLPCDYGAIFSLLKSKEIVSLFSPETPEQENLGRILVLADAAHSLGARYMNTMSGNIADITVFSFHAVKNLTTAEGGAICFNLPSQFNSEEICRYFNILILHGQNKDALAKTQKGNWKYDVVMAGYKANMTDVLASIGLIELSMYENDMLKRRKEIHLKYVEDLSKYKWAQIPVYEDSSRESSFHLFPLRIRGISEEQRDRIIQSIFSQDVSVNVHFQPLPLFTFYKTKGYNITDFPVAYDNYSREISLPVYYDLSDSDVKVVLNALINSVEKIIV
jgi:dTDP-4-amino-4,6-dideoxygalactose transaminase